MTPPPPHIEALINMRRRRASMPTGPGGGEGGEGPGGVPVRPQAPGGGGGRSRRSGVPWTTPDCLPRTRAGGLVPSSTLTPSPNPNPDPDPNPKPGGLLPRACSPRRHRCLHQVSSRKTHTRP